MSCAKKSESILASYVAIHDTSTKRYFSTIQGSNSILINIKLESSWNVQLVLSAETLAVGGIYFRTLQSTSRATLNLWNIVSYISSFSGYDTNDT